MIDIGNNKAQQQLSASVKLLSKMFSSDLLGVYLYGSALTGGLQRYSDLDVLVVTNRITTSVEKAKLIKCLLKLSGIYMTGSAFPIEVTIVESGKVKPWQYPPYCDFQYGEWLRDSFENGIIEPWSTTEMPDLALMITQVLLKNLTLWGLRPEALLAPVPYHDFMKAMMHDQGRLAADLELDTRNVLLTYARAWSTMATNTIRSKFAAADWVMEYLPVIYQPVMRRAKLIYVGVDDEYWGDVASLIKPCADFMVARINELSLQVNYDDSNSIIKLADPQIHNR